MIAMFVMTFWLLVDDRAEVFGLLDVSPDVVEVLTVRLLLKGALIAVRTHYNLTSIISNPSIN